MPKGKRQTKGGKQRAAAAPYKVGAGKTPAKTTPSVNPLFEKRPRNFGIGQAIQPKRDVTRFVRWPKYIRMQRQKRVLFHRLKVPPAINQFTNTLNKNLAIQLFSLLDKYKPENKSEKKARLAAKAAAIAEKKAPPKSSKPDIVKYGINHVTSLIESGEAKLVVIAHDVDPIELVVWLPALCRKKDVPYVIVKGKARLGQVVSKKTATVLALTTVGKADEKQLDALKTAALEQFNHNESIRKQWGGGVLGTKSIAATKKKNRVSAAMQLS